MKTPFSNPNAEFSRSAHFCAREKIYPRLFNLPCSYDIQGPLKDPRWARYDGELGIDRIVRVLPQRAKAAVMFTVQERFRRPTYQVFGDVTITGWNKVTNRPGEIHKLAALFFLYGFYDQEANHFTDWVILNTAVFMLALVQGDLDYTMSTNPRSHQVFVNLTRLDLRAIPGAVVMEVSA